MFITKKHRFSFLLDTRDSPLRGQSLVLLLTFCLLLTKMVFAQSATLGSGTKGTGPVAYWNFDESGGATAYDQSGNANNGTLNAGGSGSNTAASHMWYPDGKFGGALEFDGTDDWVNLNTAAMNGLSDFTVEYWMKSSDTGKAGTAIHATNTGNNEFIAFNYQTLTIYVKDSAWDSGVSLTNGQWRHVAITRIGSTGVVNLYVDGVLKGAPTLNTGALTVNCLVLGQEEDAVCGGFDVTQAFLGLIDEVKIYNRALSADEIKMEYTAGGAAANMGGVAASYDPWGGNAPVSWWSFDENTGSTAYDRSGNGRDGTITGATWAHGKHGNALSFNGSGDYVGCGTDTSLNFTSGNFTIGVWLKTNLGSGQTIVQRGLSQTDGYTLMADPYVHLLTHQSGAYTYCRSQRPASSGEWEYWVAVREGTNIRLYRNGVEDTPYTGGSCNAIADAVTSTRPFEIGKGSWGYANGTIDEVKIYNYARTQAQIAWDYNKGKPVGLWNMDEATSGSAVGTNNIKDSSGQGNNGSGSGSAIAWTTGRFGGALSFNGTNDYVDCGSGSSLNLGNSDFTVEGWFKRNGAGTENGQLISKFGNGTDWSRSNYEVYWADCGTNVLSARWTVGVSTWRVVCFGDAIATGVWYHFALVHSGNNMLSYLNGVYKSTTDTTGTIDSVTNSLIFGKRNSGGQQFNGTIDDVRVYNYARTAGQVRQDYNEGSAVHLGE